MFLSFDKMYLFMFLCVRCNFQCVLLVFLLFMDVFYLLLWAKLLELEGTLFT